MHSPKRINPPLQLVATVYNGQQWGKEGLQTVELSYFKGLKVLTYDR